MRCVRTRSAQASIMDAYAGREEYIAPMARETRHKAHFPSWAASVMTDAALRINLDKWTVSGLRGQTWESFYMHVHETLTRIRHARIRYAKSFHKRLHVYCRDEWGTRVHLLRKRLRELEQCCRDRAAVGPFGYVHNEKAGILAKAYQDIHARITYYTLPQRLEIWRTQREQGWARRRTQALGKGPST